MVNLDKLWEIADRYNTSKPVSGNWNTETEHELNAISKELGVSKQEAKQLMIKELGFDNDMFNGINCSLDKVEPVTPPRSIPHELPPHNNEPVKQEKKTDEDGKSFKDYLDEARKNANSSRKPIKSCFVIEHWHPLFQQTHYVGYTDEGLAAVYDIDDALQFNTEEEAKRFIKEHDNVYGGKLKIHEYPSYVRNSHQIKSSLFYIAYYGDSGDGYVGYDNEPTNDFDQAMTFNSREEAEHRKHKLQREWGSNLQVEEFDSGIESSRRPIKSSFVEEHGIYHNDTWKLEVVKLQGNTAILKPVKEDSYFCVKNPEIDEQGDLIWTSDSLPMTDYETALKEFNYHKDLNSASPTFNSRKPIKSANLPEDFNERIKKGKQFIDEYFAEHPIPRSEDNMWSVGEAMRYMAYGKRYKSTDDSGKTFYHINYDEINNKLRDIFEEYVKTKYSNKVSNSLIRSARYIATDPESGEVLGSADTYEEAVNEWGEDVTITDSEVGEGQGEENMGLFSSIDELDNNYITEGMRVTWGEKGKGKIIMWDGNDVLVQGITSTGDDYFIVGYDFKLTGNAKEPHLTWMYGDYDAGDDKEQAIQYFENRRKDISNSRKLVKSSFDDEEDTIDIETLAEELVKEGYNSDIVEEVKDKWLNEYSISELTDDEDRAFRRDVEHLALNSSKKPNGDKAFLSNIVSSVSTNNMTEEQAIKRIALRNNCNEGFARNILSEALNDETLISSGVMEIADDINKEFDIDGNIDSWLKAYMKDEGKSNTVGGEILRAFAKIRYRYYNDGDMIGRGYGKETVNPAARYLLDKMTDSSTQDIEEMLDGESDINRSDETYEDWLEGFEGSLENYLRNNEELFHTPNKEDMLDYRTEEDVDSSVTECYVEDSEGNTYWFENEGGDGDWKCYQIDSGSEKEFEVGDVVDSSQLEQYVDFADEDDYFDFDLNGLSYSAERTDGDSWEITNIDVDGGVASEGDYWSVDDLMRYGPYDSNGNELSENDLY